MSLVQKSILSVTFLIGVFSWSFLAADFDGEKENEKARKAMKPELKGGGDDEDHMDYHRRVVKEGEENLKEINRLLEEVQTNLAQKQTGSGTQERQKQVIERLDKLIKELGKSCSQCSSSSSSSSSKSKKDQTSMSQKQKQNQRQRAEDEKAKARAEQKKMQAAQQKPEEKSEKEQKNGKVENDRTEPGPPPESKVGTLFDQLREQARWGLLPPKLAEEVLFSSGKEAPTEYRQIIYRYYKRMSDYYLKSR